MLKEKEKEIARKREKDVRKKEELTQEIQKYGLWMTCQQAEAGISTLPSATAKKSAIRAQLLFRMAVLKQTAPSGTFAVKRWKAVYMGATLLQPENPPALHH